MNKFGRMPGGLSFAYPWGLLKTLETTSRDQFNVSATDNTLFSLHQIPIFFPSLGRELFHHPFGFGWAMLHTSRSDSVWTTIMTFILVQSVLGAAINKEFEISYNHDRTIVTLVTSEIGELCNSSELKIVYLASLSWWFLSKAFVFSLPALALERKIWGVLTMLPVV